jgi:hypothetical protein
VFLAALGVSLSTWLGFPVAILCCLAVFFTGVINGFTVESFKYLGQNIAVFYKYVIKPFIWLLPKFDESYNVNKYIIDGRLIDYGFLTVVVVGLLLKAMIVLAAGFLIFAKREIAKIIV